MQESLEFDPLTQLAIAKELDWQQTARPDQLFPKNNDWLYYVAQCGRGWGKTRTGSELTRSVTTLCLNTLGQEEKAFGIIAPTKQLLRRVCFEGESGLKSIIPAELYDYKKQDQEMHLWNGCTIMGFSADEPDRIRGANLYGAWCDEIGSWRYQQDAWDNLLFATRKGNPFFLVTSTPTPTDVVIDLQSNERAHIVRGSTYDKRNTSRGG